MSDFKDQIISTSIRLFNCHGFSAVSIRQIADELNVDRRNVSYHFNKVNLLETISSIMWDELEESRSSKHDFPSFENLDREVNLYTQLQSKYAFIFKDLSVIEHPVIHNKFREFCSIMVIDSEQAVAFAIEQGNMRPEPLPGAYRALCESVWAISISRLHFNTLRGIETPEELRKLIWSLIIPYFTEKGIKAFITFFGNDFYKKLGPAFNIKLKKLIF